MQAHMHASEIKAINSSLLRLPLFCGILFTITCLPALFRIPFK